MGNNRMASYKTRQFDCSRRTHYDMLLFEKL
jgi:hypothetical protein